MDKRIMKDIDGLTRHSGNDTKCDKCGKSIMYGDKVIYSWDCLEVYHPECRKGRE